MSWLRKPLQAKLSKLLGMEVRIGEVKLSLLSGTLDLREIAVMGGGGEAVLTVERVKAEVSVAGVFKKEIAVKSLAIERPRLMVVQDKEGKLNLGDGTVGEWGSGEKDGEGDEEPEAEEVKASGWKLDARRVLLVDGEVSFRSEFGKLAGWGVVLRKVLGELKRVEDEFELTGIVEAVGELGALHMTGKLTGVESVADLARAALVANVELAGIKAKVESPSIQSKQVTATIDGSVYLPTWVRAAPADLLGKFAGVQGTVGIKGTVSHEPGRGVLVSGMDVAVRDFQLASGRSPGRGGRG